MNRRELLRALSTAGALPLLAGFTPEQLLAAGRTLHARAAPRLPLEGFHALTAEEGATVTALAETILPETDTPGATAAGVPAFIDLIFGEWFSDDDRASFRAGLSEVDARARYAYERDFVALDAPRRTAVLAQMEAEATRLRGSNAYPQPFFQRIKYLTLWGYYTSEAGAVQELDYEVIPGRFDGCVPAPVREL